jgi:hypothetical protein
MVRFSDIDIGRCEACGKLFQAEPGRTRCAECVASAEEAGADATRAPLPAALRDAPNFTWQEVYEVFRNAEARQPAGEDHRCVRCRARRALNESDFCLHCHIALHHDLGDAAHELFARMEFLEEHPAKKPLKVDAMLAEKRSRTATSHINPVSIPQVKKYS